jgi:hypothetical protein
MPTAPLGTTERQLDESHRLAEVLASPDDWEASAAAPDLPPDWITVTVGIDKGRPKTFDIDPEGRIAR